MIDKIRPRLTPIVVLSLTVLILAVFWQVQNHEFINLDDHAYITENRNVLTGLTLENVRWAFANFHLGFWFPLTWLSHMLDCHLYGLNPKGHHFNNLLFHIANSLFLFFILRRMTGALWQSLFVAALFALHPLQVEPVAWVTGRKDVLSTFFWMLTIWTYINYIENPGFKKYLVVLLSFALGLMTKPMLVTIPFVLFLLDYWPLGRLRPKQLLVNHSPQTYKLLNTDDKRSSALGLIWEKVPFLALSAVSSFIAIVAENKFGALPSFKLFPLNIRFANTMVSYVHYILKMFWPHHLAVLYPHQGMPPWWQVLGALLFLGFVSFLAIKTIRRYPYLAVGWLWYIGTLVPVIGLVQIGAHSMADRYTYIPLIGLFIIFAWALPDIGKRWPNHRIGLTVLAGLALIYFMTITWKQLQHWRNSTTLFKHTLNVTSNNGMTHYYLAVVFDNQGEYEKAVVHYNEALRIYPGYEKAHNNLGVVLSKQGKFKEAIQHYEVVLRIKPDHEKAHTNLGVLLAKQGNFEEAITHHTEALKIKPDFYIAHNNLGLVLAQMGRFEEAKKHFLESLKIEPNFAETHFFLGSVYSSMGDSASVLKEYEILKSLDPNLANRLSIRIAK